MAGNTKPTNLQLRDKPQDTLAIVRKEYPDRKYQKKWQELERDKIGKIKLVEYRDLGVMTTTKQRRDKKYKKLKILTLKVVRKSVKNQIEKSLEIQRIIKKLSQKFRNHHKF